MAADYPRKIQKHFDGPNPHSSIPASFSPDGHLCFVRALSGSAHSIHGPRPGRAHERLGEHRAISTAGETDTWTIAANPGDRIAVQISKLSGGAGFTPRIELFVPDGFSLGLKSSGA
ncbi:MAG: hypothetical protein DME24_24810 [Verrucomicrobia bacterium]|nr:MAG: hypothetical protein DME24_24810 [Verrucomicrobiota bacterium]